MTKQYIKGWVEFYKLKFKVSPDVLIPRPETELLVDEVLTHARPGLAWLPLTILDVGTGAGNIAISIAKNLSSHIVSGNVKIIATDISSKALKIAKQNAKLHGVSDKITFIKSNLISSLKNTILTRPLNNCIFVSNLPYIPSQRIPYLDSSVKDFEPKIALDGGPDGFELYRKLFQQISELSFLRKLVSRSEQESILSGSRLSIGQRPIKSGMTIIGEIDYTHGELAVDEAQKYFPHSQIEVKTDLAQKQRILIIQM